MANMSNKIIPAHILRLFVWELLKSNTSMSEINTLVPVVPIDDEPKLADSGKSYLVYAYSESGKERDGQVKSGSFSTKIMATTFAELGHIINVISLAFDDSERATESLNLWSSLNSKLIGIRFTNVSVGYVEGGEPSESEGGPQEGYVSIDYEYVTSQNVSMPTNRGLWV